jgi:hypothetical protein
MKHTTRLALIVALFAAAITSVPVSSYARKQGVAPPGARPAAVSVPTQEGWGAAARAGCRYGIANGGLVPGSALSLFTGGVCLFALLDLL